MTSDAYDWARVVNLLRNKIQKKSFVCPTYHKQDKALQTLSSEMQMQ